MNVTIEEFSLTVGELWKYRTEVYLVVAVEPDKAQLRSISRRTHILIKTMDRLRQAFNRGNLTRTQEAPLKQRTDRIVADLPDRQQALLRLRLLYVRTAEAEFGGSLPREQTKALIERVSVEQADVSPPGYTTLYEWSRRYRRAGGNPLVLAGPPLRKQCPRVLRQPSVVQDMIDHWVKTLYLIAPPFSITDVRDAITCSLEDLNLKRPITHQLHIPSATTLYRIIREYDIYEKDLYQIGHSKALKKQKWSRNIPLPIHLLEKVEADTQQFDVFVVDGRGNILGRPYLTVLLAILPRVIIGYDLSLNPPCIEKTLRALKYSLRSDKDHNGLAQTFIMDNGSEFAGAKLADIMQILGSTIVFCEPYAPDQKPHVERWFKTLNTQFSHHLKGTTFSNPEHRGDYPSEDEAMFTIGELRIELDKYLHTYHNQFHRSLNTSPFEMWNQLVGRSSPPKRFSGEDIERMFRSKTSAMPHNGRIEFLQLQYSGPGVASLATRPGKRVKLNVFYDISDLGQVWISHPDRPDELLPAQAVDVDYQEGLTLEMHRLVQKELRKEQKKFNFKAARQARVNLIINLRKGKGKSALKRSARLEESGSMNLPPVRNLPAMKPNSPASLPDIPLTESTLPPMATVVKVHYEKH